MYILFLDAGLRLPSGRVGWGFRIADLGLRVWGSAFRVWHLFGLLVYGLAIIGIKCAALGDRQ